MNIPLSVSLLPRSSPIAIVGSPLTRKKEIEESRIYDDGDDDDESDIDVEGDAIKLRRKYGNKIVQTYHQESSILPSSSSIRRNYGNKLLSSSTSILNAPYLGSLSKSTNQVLSLPPMSLAGDIYDQVVEPPESIVSYGSLRDSHERGRFLDGPSSYREPTGKIRQLDHRLRYYGRQPEINIRECMQQSQKLKELRQKEQNKKKEGSKNNNEGSDDDTDNKGEKEERKMATSSLSAMMNEASQNQSVHIPNASENARSDNIPREFYSSLGLEILVPIEKGNIPSIQNDQDERHQISNNPSPRMMLSTSLTAFELLKTSNTDDTIRTDGKQRNLATLSSISPLVIKSNNNTASSSKQLNSQTTEIPRKYSTSAFEPLARSMSDPTPRFHTHSLRSGTTNTTAISTNIFSPASNQIEGFVTTATINNVMSHIDQQRGIHHIQQQQQPSFLCNENAQHATTSSSPFISNHNNGIMFNGLGSSSSHVDHDPNSDGAFGDMDME